MQMFCIACSSMHQTHTFSSCGGLEGYVYQLELVDLVGKLGDKDLVEMESCRTAYRVIEELKGRLGKLMP